MQYISPIGSRQISNLDGAVRGPVSSRNETLAREVLDWSIMLHGFHPRYGAKRCLKRSPRLDKPKQRRVGDQNNAEGNADIAASSRVAEDDCKGNGPDGDPGHHQVNHHIEPALEAEESVEGLLRQVDAGGGLGIHAALPSKCADCNDSFNLLRY